MAIPVIMPRQGQSVESCIIAKWYKKKGDPVKTGDILFSYETDKAAFDEEAKIDGTMLEIFFTEGDDVPVLTNVCVIGNPGESIAEFNPTAPATTTPANSLIALEVVTTQPITNTAVYLNSQPMPSGDQQLKISPRAKNLAEKAGVDYRYSSPTGPVGRIIERDIQSLIASGPLVTSAAREDYLKMTTPLSGTGIGGRVTTADLYKQPVDNSVPVQPGATSQYEEIKLSNIRKVIAKTMHDSIANSAQLTLNASFNATEILTYRKKLKDNKYQPEFSNITINDLILYAVSRTLTNHRGLNAHFFEEKMLLFKDVNLGVAIDTERGLMVPTIFSANTKSLSEISRTVKQLAEDCQKGSVSPDLLQGGTFTVTNLGTFGIESFTPVLNPPQTGILGVNTIVQRVEDVNGTPIFYPAIGLSLTFDHRAIDGAPAARFLQELKNNLENFSVLLVK
jgi:pyruvate dehydrogenase E2 component (dihydrolipoamide acetyltransferase)